eukprot:SM000115S23908  [mRNA]  locus=s115:169830:171286:- [translate_table: standard]
MAAFGEASQAPEAAAQPQTRLISVAAQKFISELASDSLQYCKIRQSAASKDKLGKGLQTKDKRLVLTTEDLALALKEYGVNVRRQDYYADSPATGAGALAASKGNKP